LPGISKEKTLPGPLGWGGRFGCIDRTDPFAIGPSFRKNQPFRDGIADVCDSTRCGYIDNHGNRIGQSEILPIVQIPLVANSHPLQVDPGIGFLCALESFSFVRRCPLPDHPFVGSRPVLSSGACNGLDSAVDQRTYFPVGHVVVNVPFGPSTDCDLRDVILTFSLSSYVIEHPLVPFPVGRIVIAPSLG
jgi:hypothetical protein